RRVRPPPAAPAGSLARPAPVPSAGAVDRAGDQRLRFPGGLRDPDGGGAVPATRARTVAAGRRLVGHPDGPRLRGRIPVDIGRPETASTRLRAGRRPDAGRARTGGDG